MRIVAPSCSPHTLTHTQTLPGTPKKGIKIVPSVRNRAQLARGSDSKRQQQCMNTCSTCGGSRLVSCLPPFAWPLPLKNADKALMQISDRTFLFGALSLGRRIDLRSNTILESASTRYCVLHKWNAFHPLRDLISSAPSVVQTTRDPVSEQPQRDIHQGHHHQLEIGIMCTASRHLSRPFEYEYIPLPRQWHRFPMVVFTPTHPPIRSFVTSVFVFTSRVKNTCKISIRFPATMMC